MLTFPGGIRLYVATEAVDGRKGFDGLAAIVQSQFNKEPTSGDLFIFINRRGNQIRMLFWDRDGFCLIAKRLEIGTFRRVRCPGTGEAHVEVDAAELAMLLEGIDARITKRRRRYRQPRADSTQNCTL